MEDVKNAVAGASVSRILYYKTDKSGRVYSVVINVNPSQNGRVCVDIFSDPGQETVIQNTAEYLQAIFSGSKLLCKAQQQEDGCRKFTLLVPKPSPAVTVNIDPLTRIRNEICGCAKGILEVIKCPVCADIESVDF